MRFLHISDVHLGYQQYGLPERSEDFGRAFEQAICYGVNHQADAILIAGDLFHKSAINPGAFLQASRTLRYTRDAGIPVIVVEGNHDQARYRDQLSWLDVLAHEGYIHLLRTSFPKDQPCFISPWDPAKLVGSYLDVKNVRVVGLQWLGASLPSLLPEFTTALAQLPRPGIEFTVLLTHAALEGADEQLSTYLTKEQLLPLEDLVQYLALGHLHKPFVEGEWAYNPGALEVCDFSELQWKKGWFDVEIAPDGSKKATHIKSAHRPFFYHKFSVEGYPSAAALYQALQVKIRHWSWVWKRSEKPPVVEIQLEGELGFEPHELDFRQVERLIREETHVLHVLLPLNRLRSPGLEVSLDETLPQADLELSVLRQIAERNLSYAPRADHWARVLLGVKAMALNNAPPDEILALLQAQLDQGEEKQHAY